ncbi:MAG: BlaI/MecI/CopY family transcriptional regulator [Bacteroidales bacterium]|nr:BlaI/MecI/CopY family transcriptional regulator [Bacteroidales bacterium]
MKQKNKIRPTEAELEILQILWMSEPSTVRYVNDILNEKKDVGYTTTLKIMQIMTKKGFVERNKEKRTHIYKVVISEKETKNLLMNKFLDTTFGGSAAKLVMQALGNHKTHKEELKKIKDLIKEIEENE